MKKAIIALIFLAVSNTALADRGYRGGNNYNRGYNNNWVVPAIIGGAVVGGLVYGATRPPPVQYYAPPVQYYAPPPPPVYVEPAPQIPYGYRYEQILDASCNCYRTVLVPN